MQFGSKLASAPVAYNMSTIFLGQPLVVPGFLLQVFGTQDSQGLSLLGLINEPSCAQQDLAYTLGVSVLSPSFLRTHPGPLLVVVTFNNFTYTIQSTQGVPTSTLSLPNAQIAELTIFATKHVTVDGHVDYAYTFSSPVLVARPYGYPETALMLSMSPTVTVRTESRGSLLVVAGAIGGSWGAVLLVWGIVNSACSRVLHVDSHAQADGTEASKRLMDNEPTPWSRYGADLDGITSSSSVTGAPT